jgi:hypothetical protein
VRVRAARGWSGGRRPAALVAVLGEVAGADLDLPRAVRSGLVRALVLQLAGGHRALPAAR